MFEFFNFLWWQKSLCPRLLIKERYVRYHQILLDPFSHSNSSKTTGQKNPLQVTSEGFFCPATPAVIWGVFQFCKEIWFGLWSCYLRIYNYLRKNGIIILIIIFTNMNQPFSISQTKILKIWYVFKSTKANASTIYISRHARVPIWISQLYCKKTAF